MNSFDNDTRKNNLNLFAFELNLYDNWYLWVDKDESLNP